MALHAAPYVCACLTCALTIRGRGHGFVAVFQPAGVFLSLFDVDVFVSLVTFPANDNLALRPITTFTFVCLPAGVFLT